MTKDEVLELLDKMIEDRRKLGETYPDEIDYWNRKIEALETAKAYVNLLEEA